MGKGLNSSGIHSKLGKRKVRKQVTQDSNSSYLWGGVLAQKTKPLSLTALEAARSEIKVQEEVVLGEGCFLIMSSQSGERASSSPLFLRLPIHYETSQVAQ